MIIWRSWGFAGIVLPLVVGGILNVQAASTFYVGLGFLVGSAVTFPLGWYLNKVRPHKQLAQWEAARRADLDQLVGSGAFRYNDEAPPPRSLDEARFQAEHLYAVEQQHARKNLFNRSTAFFIPMQWFAVVTAVLGVIFMTM